MSELSKLCLHTITTKPWTLDQCLLNYEKVGIKGISIWRNVLENQNLSTIKTRVKNAGLETVSLVRGGFFTGSTIAEKQKAIDENKKIIEEAAQIGAPLIVLVCGATPGISIKENLKQIQEGIEAIIPFAASHQVKLGIEPLHPMYADKRSAVSSLRSANQLASNINSNVVGVTIDVFHVWWEDDLEEQIKLCAKNNKLFSYHICDWKLDMSDMLNDRGLMGDGIINVKEITKMVEATGFNGYREVEIFSNQYWKMDQNEFLNLIVKKYKQTYLN
jgi:sugar phosphate isomerase/epimerase